MKKLLFVACLAAFCLTGCNNASKNTTETSSQQEDSLNNIIAQKDSELNDMMGTLNEIQDGLNQINEAENRVTVLKNGEGQQETAAQGERAVHRHPYAAEPRADRQTAKQLANSSFQGEQFKKTIANLRETARGEGQAVAVSSRGIGWQGHPHCRARRDHQQSQYEDHQSHQHH